MVTFTVKKIYADKNKCERCQEILDFHKTDSYDFVLDFVTQTANKKEKQTIGQNVVAYWETERKMHTCHLYHFPFVNKFINKKHMK